VVVAGLAVLVTNKVNESGCVPCLVVENWLAW
jgi:hypothetical protein